MMSILVDVKTLADRSVKELQEIAAELEIKGRSKLRKTQLVAAIREAVEAFTTAQAESERLERNARADAAERKAFQRAPLVKLSVSERIENYQRQNGTHKLTPAQWRQVKTKHKRAGGEPLANWEWEILAASE